MTIRSEIRTVEISLRYWNGGWNAGYDPDCFDDLEPNFPEQFTERAEDDDTIILAPESELAELIDWWKNERDTANAGYDHDEFADDEAFEAYNQSCGWTDVILTPLTDEARDRGDHWDLIVRAI